MAAGQGFKTFTTGEVLTASDVNGYLMQGVLVFASAAARDAAITSPQEGQYAYLKDTNVTYYYDGSTWVVSGATGDITSVTAGTGISGGGASGDVTITNSMATAIDAKGDLVAGTGADAFSRLAVGANDTVLTADSTTATGLKWATPTTIATYVGCAAFRNAAQSITKNTNTLLTLPSEQFDTDGFHSTVTNTGRFTVPTGKGGKYNLTASVSFDTAITEQVWLMLYVNGSAVTAAASGLSLGVFQQFPGTANTDYINGSVTYSYSAGDYAEVYVFHNGTNTPINVDAARVTFDYLGA